MFRGEYEHSLDVKGRTVVPSKYREELGNSFIITIGTSHCLNCYPLKKYEEIERVIDSLPTTPENEKVKRLFFGSSAEVEVDSSGRILIPTKLREYAGFKGSQDDVVFIGMGKKVEIWAKSSHDEYINDYANFDSGIESLAEKIGLSL
ncbi:MAG: division/cell wall cluster transcriptional repressor MraZ [Lachnospiraceae bacterium]|nr:division/cell wall cluster transcriptional repressor MraZ [Lachnospiraceae bacterium]